MRDLPDPAQWSRLLVVAHCNRKVTRKCESGTGWGAVPPTRWALYACPSGNDREDAWWTRRRVGLSRCWGWSSTS